MTWYTKWGTCLYTSASGYKVYENFFYRWLTLGSPALQTVINKKNPARPVLYYIPALTLMARNLPGPSCLLGLGGAGVAHILAPSSFAITAVDNSAEIIQIAQQYFMINTIANLNVVHQSAELYLEQCTTQYSHLLIDLYNAHHFPEECNNDHFFLQSKRCLKPNGFIAINLANADEQYSILQKVKKYFRNTLVIPIKKCANMVIIASNHHAHDEFISSLLATKEIQKIILLNPWGCVGG